MVPCLKEVFGLLAKGGSTEVFPVLKPGFVRGVDSDLKSLGPIIHFKYFQVIVVAPPIDFVLLNSR